MMYEVTLSPRAYEDAKRLEKSEPAAFKKEQRFIEELREHPNHRHRTSRTAQRQARKPME